MANISKKLFIGGIIIVFLAFLMFLFLQYWNYTEDYLILGVPYNGYFSGTTLAGDGESAIAMILRYWGDGRLSFRNVQDNFRGYRVYSLNKIRDFFTGQGYSTDIVSLKSISDVIALLKKNKEIPLLASLPSQYSSSLTGETRNYYAVIIGAHYSRRGENWLIIHNSYRGNNYMLKVIEFPFEAIVIKPGDKIASLVRGPQHSAYPPRLAIMDDLDILLLSRRWGEIDTLFMNLQKEKGGFADIENTSIKAILFWHGVVLSDKEYEQFLSLWEGIISLPGFKKIYPGDQVLAYDNAGRFAFALKKYDIAIDYFKKAANLDHDLNKPANGWPRDSSEHQERFIFPWYHLGMAYEAKGDLKAAENSYLEAIKTANMLKTDKSNLENLLKKIRSKI